MIMSTRSHTEIFKIFGIVALQHCAPSGAGSACMACRYTRAHCSIIIVKVSIL